MKYKISTDEVIIKHIQDSKPGDAILHAWVSNPVFPVQEGVVTACQIKLRLVTLQFINGSKGIFSFDAISVPEKL